ncbi:hypothetical protein ANCCAN_08790 [Ancylostoma caninum]|uniref:Uncharacterized protein n=1 Tax=Ancylostoma caninum TaxID=29170 RepID=A0A368GQL8_ANCCA|nr:hypothetical protein ANCCAN_08790 [Ancylostoma caninum]
MNHILFPCLLYPTRSPFKEGQLSFSGEIATAVGKLQAGTALHEVRGAAAASAAAARHLAAVVRHAAHLDVPQIRVDPQAEAIEQSLTPSE